MPEIELAPGHPLSAARFVCLACHKTAAARDMACPRCQVDLLRIAEPAVRQELLQHAEQVLDRRAQRELALVVLGGVAVWLLLAPWLGYWLALLLGLGGAVTAHAAYRVFGRGSFAATRSARRRRLSRELGVDVNATSTEGQPLQRPRLWEHFPPISEVWELLMVPIVWPLTYLSHVFAYRADRLIREHTTLYQRLDRRLEERAAPDPMTLSTPALLAWLGTRMVD